MKFKYSFLIMFIFLNCTTIGLHNKFEYKKFSYKEDIIFRICILNEPGISANRINSLMNSLQEEISLYNLKLDWKIVGERERAGFFTAEIFESLERIPLLDDCDRMLVLLNRNLGDFFFHILFPEILGLVDANTRTRGFVYADYFSLNILFGSTPSKVLIHENYHFLGCDHNWIMNDCYKNIYTLREEYSKSLQKKMFPTYTGREKIIIENRDLINKIILDSLNKNLNP